MLKKYLKISLGTMAVMGAIMTYTRKRVPSVMHFSQKENVKIRSLPIITLNPADDRENNTGYTEKYTANLLGIFPVKEVVVTHSEERYVNVSGKPFGIKMFCDGVMLVGFSDILTNNGYQNPAKLAGLKIGDIITHINGKSVQTNEDVERIIIKNGSVPLKVDYIRGEQENTALLVAVKDTTTDTLRTGMWVRDSGRGIGTMTFFENDTGYFAGLGHGIKDVDTQQELRLLSGEIVPVKITGVIKSRNGSAGRLKGSFTSAFASGKVLKNDTTGVYGRAYSADSDNYMPVASPGQIKQGKAYILTTISGSIPQKYEIEIEKVNLTSRQPNKNMVIKVTDSRLLSLTGGIVAGMSGSPIIQDDRLVGAVTHVFVNNVARGYGIFARNMLRSMDSTAEKYGDTA